jgi:hypothetical protein
MNSPKEKASRLVADFIKHSRAEKDIKPIQSAKQCALIAVDEIIEELLESGEFWMKSRLLYWEEVKQEIKKL